MIKFKSEEELWNILRTEARNSNCLKTKTAAGVVKEDAIIALGSNSCAPGQHKYYDILSGCPRMNIKTGQSYELCSPVHAEVMACLNVRPNRDRSGLKQFAGYLKVPDVQIISAFTDSELSTLRGSVLYLAGHYWACDNCIHFLNTVGISEIKLDKTTGKVVKEGYLLRNLG